MIVNGFDMVGLLRRCTFFTCQVLLKGGVAEFYTRYTDAGVYVWQL
jgi:hypothetical protein